MTWVPKKIIIFDVIQVAVRENAREKYCCPAGSLQFLWDNEWQQYIGLREQIKEHPSPWAKRSIPRRCEVIINRLRVGHPLVTHGYLINNSVQEPPRDDHLQWNSSNCCSFLELVHWSGKCRHGHFENVNSLSLRSLLRDSALNILSLRSLLGDSALNNLSLRSLLGDSALNSLALRLHVRR